MRRTDSTLSEVQLRLDPIACDGVGMCAHLAPTLLHLDPWGFPILPVEALDRAGRRAAGRAIGGCPRRALYLDGEVSG